MVYGTAGCQEQLSIGGGRANGLNRLTLHDMVLTAANSGFRIIQVYG